MLTNKFKAILKTALRVAMILPFAAVVAFGQQTINLTAAPTTATMPDGTTVPMWGYFCGTPATTNLAPAATCAALNPASVSTVATVPSTWSPVVITVPAGQILTINLTNSLTFTPTGATVANPIPTSLTIVGQLGGGLGTTATATASPVHGTDNTATWSTVANVPFPFTPPAQGTRVQSFSTEVAPGATTPLIFGTATIPLRSGTYLMESGTHPSIQGPMGLYGMLVVTTAPGAAAGIAYPAVGTVGTAGYVAPVTYNAEVPVLFSEIDPNQNKAVDTAVRTAGFTETAVWSGQPGGCGNPNSAVGVVNTCYPPAVNYSPLNFLINGVAFNKTNAAGSLFPAAPASGLTAGTGTVLVRLVNAGLKMHVPSIVGSQTGVAVAPATIPPAGFSLIAEDGNRVPGVLRVQSDVFMAPGKTYDVMVNVPAAAATALPIYDRELSLSANGVGRDGGMIAYLGINGSGLPVTAGTGVFAGAVANADTYNSLVPCTVAPCAPLVVSDPGKGVIANDVNVYGVRLIGAAPTTGTLIFNENGTFTYTPNVGTGATSFQYCANNGYVAPTTVGGTATCSAANLTATVTLGAATIEANTGIVMNNIAYVSNEAAHLKIAPPGPLSVDKDLAGYPLSVNMASITPTAGLTLNVDSNGGFNASVPGAGTYTFTYTAQNSQGTISASTATVTLNFPTGSGLTVSVVDGSTRVPLTGQDYRWVIQEDRSFYVDPNCTTNAATPNPGCVTNPGTTVPPTYGVNFHPNENPYVAQGCTGPQSCEGSSPAGTGQTMIDTGTPCTGGAGVPAGCSLTAGTHIPAVCDVGNGVCRPDTSTGFTGKTPVFPSEVALDPTKRYYISVLPGDAANPFYAASPTGHGMGGAPISPGQTAVTVLSQASPYPTAKLSVFVFEDDFPLNGEHDAGGGIDVLATQEPGLGGFQIHMWDAFGGNGDFTGQMGFDMFNEPLSNSLAGTIDPATGNDACPVSKNPRMDHAGNTDPTATGITGFIVTCPRFESDNITLSPLAGQAVIANLMPGRWGVIATPGADRIAKGEEWLQTNTLDGQKAHDSFTRIGEPSYFQEFGPASYHVSIGFANPKIINSRLAGVCAGNDPFLPGLGGCTNTITGKITGERLSRPPDERLYSSGSHDAFVWTQCFVSVGDPDGEDFAFTKCDDKGNFTVTGLPPGDWRITTFDQWNDQLVDGLSTPVRLGSGICTGAGSTATFCNMGDIATTQWQTNLWTRTFVDDARTGVATPTSAGIGLINTAVRLRDGSIENLIGTDFTGTANFNETFPLFAWYVVETDPTRYKTTGIHTVYDAGGPADGSSACGQTGYPPCGTATGYNFLANTYDSNPLPGNLSVPGAVYCSNADCAGNTIAGGPVPSSTSNHSTGRIDPPSVWAEGWQGFPGQSSFIEFGKAPYIPGENGGIQGHVIYASTRPFDDPYMLVQTQWEPLVPNVTINLYQEGFAADGVTPTLMKVDTTTTSSWDAWAQGFRSDGLPNMNCPGQSTADLFYFSLYNQPSYLDTYNAAHGGPAATPLPYNSEYKCYDGMHNWNQVQPAPYDGRYAFPSVTGTNPTTGNTTGTNCTICVKNPDPADAFRFGKENMLPAGKYVVEVVPPPGFELVKEEDKNILIGDNFIAPVTQQFATMSNIFIIPDQAQVASQYNANNAQNPTQNMGASPLNGIVPGFVPEPLWPCVGQTRIVPDHISLFPESQQVSPFAGATRNLCDRKEVTLTDQMGAIAKFFVYTSTHLATGFTGGITDDFTSEFDPFSPQFGEKFAPPDLPIAIKDWTGAEISRVYADHWGAYNGMTYSTWEVNPPNPTGYAPTMMIFCMNDPGPISGPGGTMITDPLFNPAYSQFCYEEPFMPAVSQYLDTPVVPTSAFAGAGYNNVDCAYPDSTPSISSVTSGDAAGPWVSAAGHSLTTSSLPDKQVNNFAYSGPSATTAPFNQKTVNRHFGFGAAAGTVTIGGKAAIVTGWSDTQITVTVPAGVPDCPVQQQSIYGGSHAQCGQLVITAANGQQSIDTVTVTIGGKAPTIIASGSSIQTAIDVATPGDLIIVPPGTYRELLIMWKPVRLQGVGAASTILDASPHPAGKLDPWRARVNCLFGLSLNGQPYNPGVPITFPPTAAGPIPGINTNPYDPTGTYSCGSSGGTAWAAFTGGPNNPQVDRLPLEAVVGWDTTVNGNLAQLLQEPSLMGAFEGAGITVLAKGVRYPPNVNIFGIAPDTAAGSFVAHEGQMPVPTIELAPLDCNSGPGGTNPFPSNFQCNPSSIDGLSVTNSSQGGGGIFVHAWGHNLQIANNRIYNNTGTLTGGITIGQGESPDSILANNNGDPVGYNGGTLAAFDQQPWTCLPGAVNYQANTPFGYDEVANPPGTVPNQQLPYCYNLNVNVHNNAVTANSSIGDEVYSGTPAGAGGVSFCAGADYYKFNYNWICGNLSTGDGGGAAHIGFSWNGDIEHNTILFNQSTNPTIATNGGGLIIMGAAPDGAPVNAAVGTECGSVTDVDCAPGLPDGTGPGLVINANLIMGNAAESGSGGGLRLQSVNGPEVSFFPANPARWFSPLVTNNIIANNVAGWDGGGVSLQDALMVNFINNSVVSNDTTASSGVLFNTLGAPLASAPGATNQTTSATTSAPQPAGFVTMLNSANLTSSFAGKTIVCPVEHPNCRSFSNPKLDNNLFWQNRSFYIGVGALSPQYQQHIVTLYNAFTTTPAAGQTATGACPAGASYWDIGVRGDTGPSNHASGLTLNPEWSVLTDAADYPGTAGNPSFNTASNPTVVAQYCNGSRIPPEFGGTGWQVPPGISDATVPNPIFNLTPTATVDEGNNWVNIQWGPLTLTNPTVVGAGGNYGGGAPLGNYRPAAGSPAIDYVQQGGGTFAEAPKTDFFGNPRPDAGSASRVDIGAVEFTTAAVPAPTLTSINPNTGVLATSVPVTLTGTNLTGASWSVATIAAYPNITFGPLTVVSPTTATSTLTIAANTAIGAKNLALSTPGGITNPVTFTVTPPPAPTLTGIAPPSALRGSSVLVTLTGTNLTGGTLNTAAYPNITVSGVTVTATQITATFTITAATSIGAKSIIVTTPGGPSNAETFTVLAPSLTSISPTSGLRGTTVPVTITGNGLTGATAVTVTGTGVTAGAVVVNAAGTQITANFAIAATAATTTRNVTVVTPNTPAGGTNAVQFTVLGPTLTLISPTSGARGSTVPVTLTGTGLSGATAVSMGASTAGVTCTITGTPTATTVTANCSITATAPTTTRQVVVTTPIGMTAVLATTPTFTVLGPTLTSISPTSGARGTTVPATLSGSLLTGATAVNVSGTGVTCTVTGTPTATTVTASCIVATNAALTARTVNVMTPNGVTAPNAAVTFTVTGPTVTAISPTANTRGGAAFPVTITGTNLTGATAVTFSGTGVSATITGTPTSTTVTANVTITATAAQTARTFTVTTPNGTGSANPGVTLTVQ
jgi:hypothetical protein